jgi:hypothetical protein
MIDEADTFLGHNSVMRGVLNCGNTRRTAFVLRIADNKGKWRGGAEQPPDEKSKVVRYSCWCPKVIAMIGNVPETLADRSIVINMVRKLTSEKCAPLAEFNPKPLQRKCARWAADNSNNVRLSPRQELCMVSDRASDTYEPLMVLASMAGGGWRERLAAAAEKLCAHDNTEAEAASLLLDTMAVFIVMGAKRIFSRDLANQLKGKNGWAVYDITSRQQVNELAVARILRRYAIKPGTVRIGDQVGKGYKWEQFTAALQHYVSKPELARKLAELKEMNELAMQAKKEREEKEAAQEAAERAAEQAEEAADEAEFAIQIPEPEKQKIAKPAVGDILGLLRESGEEGEESPGGQAQVPETVAVAGPKQGGTEGGTQQQAQPRWSLADLG